MVGCPMEELQFTNPSDVGLERTIPAGFFSEAELTAFSLLIDRRRTLPLYFGDCWRCCLCTFECFDFFDMVDHLLQAHDPEPFNEADEAELEGCGVTLPCDDQDHRGRARIDPRLCR
jgi:NAD-dependent dihydropyrimidine dehydrogenase PreA subunit